MTCHIGPHQPKATGNRTITGVASPGPESGIANGNRPPNQGPKSARLGVVQCHDGTAGNGRYQSAEDGILKIERHGKCREDTQYRQ